MLSYIQQNQQMDPGRPAFYIGIGILLVIVIIVVLWRRQRRRFNE